MGSSVVARSSIGLASRSLPVGRRSSGCGARRAPGRRPTRAALCAMRAFETFIGDEHPDHPRPKCKPDPGDPGFWRIIDGEIVAKPLILLTNDDGIYAQGILAAWQELRKIGEVEVVAPDAERSAVGHAITLLLPLRTKEVVRRNVRFGYAVNGMPADCVKIAIKPILPRPPDLVVSGINLGSNTV